jgi:aquaporin Z
MMQNFRDPSQEWRRLFTELFGTFLLVLVAAGGGMTGQAFPDTISRAAAVTAPGLMVLGIILLMGSLSGAHLNPTVSVAFALRGDFRRQPIPGYILLQLAGAALAAWFCQAVIGVSAVYGSNYPAPSYSGFAAFLMEAVLTLGLVSVIVGTASGAQNVGVLGALGVGGYIAPAGLWGSPISGTSLNPARTFGPDLIGADFAGLGVHRRPDHRSRAGHRDRVRAPRPVVAARVPAPPKARCSPKPPDQTTADQERPMTLQHRPSKD